MTSVQNYNASGFSAVGQLKNYWHVVALSRELKPGSSLKRKLYGKPLLIWRDTAGRTYAIDDCCAHRSAPLEVMNFHSNRVVCPYHGWQYNQTGKLCHVPSDSEAAQRMKCSIPTYSTTDLYGFVWIYPNSSDSNHSSCSHLQDFLEFEQYANWTATFQQLEFATSDELLIDNFMDPTHTAVVHDGLIRSSGQSTEHEMLITTHHKGVSVHFAERDEHVGIGMRLLFGRSMSVQHSDEFLLPNLVRVTYIINGQRCFVALIACTPIEPLGHGRTLATLQLRYNFGRFTRFAQPIVGWLARKVMKQDYNITANQFANLASFPNSPQHKIAADAVATRVNRLRQQLITGEGSIEPSSQTVRLTF